MNNSTEQLIAFLRKNDGINDKAKLAKLVSDNFHLTKDRSVYYCKSFAVRFSSSSTQNFGNTVLSLSNLQKFDDRPFIVCLVTPTYNYTFLANTTFLKKISHSSQELRENNIRGSFNGSDIMRDFEGINNTPENIERLFNIHSSLGFDGNLTRLVEATNNISPSGRKFEPNEIQHRQILLAPARAIRFVQSKDAQTLKEELDAKVEKFKNEILLAALIENVNVRGRIIEYLIAGEDDRLRQEIVNALQKRTNGIPQFKTENTLGDYTKEFKDYVTETDVKTKIMILDSNPKAYNLDKMLEIGDVKLVSFLGDTSLFISNEQCSLADKVVSDASLYVFHKEQHKKGCVVLKEDVPYAVFYEQEQYSVFKINMEIFTRFVEL